MFAIRDACSEDVDEIYDLWKAGLEHALNIELKVEEETRYREEFRRKFLLVDDVFKI